MNTKDAVFRVFELNQEGDIFRGSAFAIAPNVFLTCAHVFKEIEGKRRYVLRGPGRHGDICVIWLAHPEGKDCSLGILQSGAGGVDVFLPIKLCDVTSDLGALTCMGFYDASSSLQQWTDHVSGNNLQHGWVALQNAISKGVSGGPVLSDGKVVAIVFADNPGSTQKYIIPLISVYEWIETEASLPLMVSSPSLSACAGLAQVKIRPPVRAADIPDSIIHIFAMHLRDQTSAGIFIERAMDDVRAVNRENFRDSQITIHPASYTPAYPVPGDEYWTRVLLLAAQKSRRTLAALFLTDGAPDPRFMSGQEEKEYNYFLNWLINP